MELAMAKGFSELNEQEMLEVDGGFKIDSKTVGEFLVGAGVECSLEYALACRFAKKSGQTIGTIVGGPVGMVAGSIAGGVISVLVCNLLLD